MTADPPRLTGVITVLPPSFNHTTDSWCEDKHHIYSGADWIIVPYQGNKL
jgi:hypothetical protein